MSESLSTVTLEVANGQEAGTVSRGRHSTGQNGRKKHPWVLCWVGENNLGGFIL